MDCKGNIYPCICFKGRQEFILGNIFDSPEAFDINRNKLLERIQRHRNEECGRCWAINLCGGVCAYNGFLSKDETDKLYTVNCQLIRHLIEEAMILLSEISTRPPVIHCLNSVYSHRYFPALVPSAMCFYTDKKELTHELFNGKTEPIILNHKTQLRGYKLWEHDKTASIRVETLWNELNFYIKFSVRGVFPQHCDENHIRFAITENANKIPVEYCAAVESGKGKLLVNCMQDPDKRHFGEIRQTDITLTQNNDVIEYSLAIPWKALKVNPSPHVTYKFNVAVFLDEHPYGKKSWLEWAPGMIIEYNPSLFGNLHLLK